MTAWIRPPGWDEAWDYSGVPPREWEWPWRKDEWEHGTTDARVDGAGIYWGGELLTGLSKGGYDVAFQSFEQFLQRGPPSGARDAEAHAAEIRDHVLAHRRSGPATRAHVEVHLVGWTGDPRLQSLAVGLFDGRGGRSFDARYDEGFPSADPLEIWSGTVPSGTHRVAMHVLYGRSGASGYESRYLEDVSFSVARGASAHVVVELRPDLTARVVSANV